MTLALVTGSSRGIGYATAQALAGKRISVVLTSRSLADAESAATELRNSNPGMDVEALELDVTSESSVAAAADEIGRRRGSLDILINNAGVLPEATDAEPHEFASTDLFRSTFATNVFGLVATTEAFVPLLKKSVAGRVVNVSTRMGSLTDQSDPGSPYFRMVVPAYQASKAAVNSITVGLAKKLSDTPIKVTAVCPGFVQTDLTPANRAQAPLTAEDAARVVTDAAVLPDTAASGTFIDRDGAVPW
ncbi:SDR family NAD(P)-dependent oxidoreductase [Rhodococcus sp. NPDC058521]|uniref:SDR family NAD(P)-dependent oxidoreductase n=1 Tax=Rhodococcus sp. NPDC058521 TaxID=3346536 RepID=UPI00365DF7CF